VASAWSEDFVASATTACWESVSVDCCAAEQLLQQPNQTADDAVKQVHKTRKLIGQNTTKEDTVM
jgi:hypothetical protein